ncbi:CoA-binding protein [Marinibaculum pumilum]|uniref:CoA-binding protein n=1 Tax=Marinibaculum pumilum TaxID=1766165 RepID=A0ABV7KU05_9PROT
MSTGQQPASASASGPADESYSDAFIREVLRDGRTIAMVGASANWNRPSFFAMKYLQAKGFRVIPVNPKEAAAGTEILGEKCYASLAEIPEKVDMVDCFRNADAVPAITEEAIAIGAKILWMQLGVRHDEAAAKARAAGLRVVMNRCPKIEYGRLSGEIGWMGRNTGVISSKRKRKV